jgi:hypothetical protein
MSICVGTVSSPLDTSQSPQHNLPPALSTRRHRRRLSHHHLVGLPTRPVSTAPYFHPHYPTHRPRPSTPNAEQDPVNGTSNQRTGGTGGPLSRSQSVRLCRDDKDSTAIRPLDILAPRPKKAGSRLGHGWQMLLASSTTSAQSIAGDEMATARIEGSPRQWNRSFQRPLSFCFGENLGEHGQEADQRMVSFQRELELARQARREAEAEAEAAGPVVVDLPKGLTKEPASPISPAGESEAVEELLGILSTAGSPVLMLGEHDIPTPPAPNTMAETEIRVAVPAVSPTFTAALQIAMTTASSCETNTALADPFEQIAQDTARMTAMTTTACAGTGSSETGEPLQCHRNKARKVPPLPIKVDVPALEATTVTTSHSSTAGPLMDGERDGAAVSSSATLSTDVNMVTEHASCETPFMTTVRPSLPVLSSLELQTPNGDIDPAAFGRSPIVRTTNPLPLDWSFATTPRVPKHPMVPFGSADVDDNDDSDLVSDLPTFKQQHDAEPTNATQMHAQAAMMAAAEAGFLNTVPVLQPPGRPGAPCNLIDPTMDDANGMPVGYQRPRSMSVSVASARPNCLKQLGVRPF